MEAISSADFAHNQEPEDKPVEASNKPDYDKILNAMDENPTKTFAKDDKPKVSSFQQMLKE